MKTAMSVYVSAVPAGEISVRLVLVGILALSSLGGFGPAYAGRGARHAPQAKLLLIETFQLRLELLCNQLAVLFRQKLSYFRVIVDRIGDYDVLTRREALESGCNVDR